MRILNLDNWCEEATKILREFAEVKELRWAEEQYEGLITSLSKPFESEHLLMFPNLKFVASCTTGLDHLPLEALRNNGIKVISLMGETDFLQDVWATAEHTMALILSLVRHIPAAFDDVKQGNWKRDRWQGSELHGKTLGIVGYGRVGRQVARFAEAFGMKVIWHDPYITVPEHNTIPDCCRTDREMNDLLRESDIVTVHVPLNESTRGMFGAEQFRLMKPTAYFINTSRGAVVDENALIEALEEKYIAGAALDVVINETGWSRFHNDLLLQADNYEEPDNFIITPHIAGNTAGSREKTQFFIANKIKEYVNGL